MIAVSAQNKLVAKFIASALQVERPPVARYLDNEGRSEVSILKAEDRPNAGTVSYASIGLSESIIGFLATARAHLILAPHFSFLRSCHVYGSAFGE